MPPIAGYPHTSSLRVEHVFHGRYLALRAVGMHHLSAGKGSVRVLALVNSWALLPMWYDIWYQTGVW